MNDKRKKYTPVLVSLGVILLVGIALWLAVRAGSALGDYTNEHFLEEARILEVDPSRCFEQLQTCEQDQTCSITVENELFTLYRLWSGYEISQENLSICEWKLDESRSVVFEHELYLARLPTPIAPLATLEPRDYESCDSYVAQEFSWDWDEPIDAVRYALLESVGLQMMSWCARSDPKYLPDIQSHAYNIDMALSMYRAWEDPEYTDNFDLWPDPPPWDGPQD